MDKESALKDTFTVQLEKYDKIYSKEDSEW